MAPTEPPPNEWHLPDPRDFPVGQDLVGVGADIEPGTMLAGYRRGLFPMELAPGTLGWYSPDPRGLLPLDRIHVSRSLRRSMRAFRVSFDVAFAEVVSACADPGRDGRWITGEFQQMYLTLHRLGWAHSVEVWQGDRLAGGLFGVEVGGLFAGESMFHRVTDASKAAMVGAVRQLQRAPGERLFDVQWATPHLVSMGVVEVTRGEYLDRLAAVRETAPAFVR